MIVWPGLRRSVSAISRLFNSASFDAPLTHTAVPTRAASGTTGTFTRATTATVRDNEGVLRTAIAGEARFEGARRVRNLLSTTSENFSNVVWSKTGSTSVTGTNVLNFPVAVEGVTQVLSPIPASGSKLVLSAKLSAPVAGTFSLRYYDGTSIFVQQFNLTTTPTEYSFALTTGAVGDARFYLFRDAADTATQVTCEYAQVEDVTAQTTQTAGEYVSVGVTSAPYYHGSMVDGVKCFPTDLSGNPLPTEYTYDAVSLNGVAGTYVSTPDSVANSITGDIDIRCLNDYQTVNYTPMAKGETNGERSWRFYVEASGLVNFDHFVGGLDAGRVTATSTASVALPFSGWIRATVDVDDEAGNHIVRFYTSSDGASWAQLGADVVVAGVISLFESNSIVAIGEWAGVFFGASKAYRAQIYNGINGTLAVDFDASRYEGGSTLTGSTGETWTLQGNAVIHPTNSPNLGYVAEGARTNLCLQSQTFGTTWSPNVTTVSSNAAVAPDGTTTADLVYPNSTGVNRHIGQSGLTTTAATWTFSFYAKYAGAGGWAYCIDLTGSSAVAYFDIQNGAVGTVSAGHSASIEDAGNGWYRCSLITTTAPAGAANVYIGNADANGATTITANGTNGIYLWGAQLELGSFASSYIATTTTAGTRNADILTYSGGDIPNIKSLLCGFRREVGASNSGYIAALTNGTLNELAASYMNTATQHRFNGIDGGVGQWDTISSNAYTPGTQSKMAQSFATNDVKMAKDGVAQTPDTVATMPTVTQLEIGCVTGAFQLNGNVGPIYGWTRNLSQSELNAVTA